MKRKMVKRLTSLLLAGIMVFTGIAPVYAEYVVVNPVGPGFDPGYVEEENVNGLSRKHLQVTIKEKPVFDPNVEGLCPEVRVTYKNDLLVEGEDYTLSFSNNKNAGNDALATVTGMGLYEGLTVEKKFSIQPESVENLTRELIVPATYCGGPVFPTNGCIATDDGYPVSELVGDFETQYYNNVNVTTEDSKAIMRIIGKGNYQGYVEYEFDIEEEEYTTTPEEIVHDVMDGRVVYEEWADNGPRVATGTKIIVTMPTSTEKKKYYITESIYHQGTKVKKVGENYPAQYETVMNKPGIWVIEYDLTRSDYCEGYKYNEQTHQTIWTKWVETTDLGEYGFVYEVVSESPVTEYELVQTPPIQVDDNRIALDIGCEYGDFDLGLAEWSVSDESVASVDKGILTIKQPGYVEAYATYGDTTFTWQADYSAKLNIGKKGEILYYDVTTGEPVIGFNTSILQKDVNYTVETTEDDTYLYVTVQGCGDYTGTIDKRFYKDTGYPSYAEVEEVVLDTTEARMELYETLQLSATAMPAIAEDKAITWSSDNRAVATVDQNGLVMALEGGEAVITASTANGVVGTCKIYVHSPIVAIQFDSMTMDLNRGASKKICATPIPATATEKPVWTSDDEAIATVDQNGMVTAVGKGNTWIKATAENGVYASCFVIVTVPLQRVSFEQSEITMNVGEELPLKVLLTPEDATLTGDLEWDSYWDYAASVDDNGVVTAHNPGTTEITVTTKDGLWTTCDVTVVQPIREVVLSQDRLTIYRGDYEYLSADVEPYDTTMSTDLTWTSSNPDIASVSQIGQVNGLSVGKAVITVTAVNGMSSSCEVEVIKDPYEEEIAIEKVALNKTKTILYKGEGEYLEATISPWDHDMDGTITWTSSNPIIATVDSRGYVKAIRSGTTYIIAETVNGKTARCRVDVVVDLASGETEPHLPGYLIADSKSKSLYRVTGTDTVIYEMPEPGKTLKKLTIPETITDEGWTYRVTAIKEKAFNKYTTLTKITIPANVVTIGKQAFNGCKKLKTITVKTSKLTTKSVGKNAFKGIYKKATFKVPKAKIKAYKKLFKAKGAGKNFKVKK